MLDDSLRKLRHLKDGVPVPIDMPLDDDGYTDRRCPGGDCAANFKLLFNYWRDRVADERVG